MDLHSWKINYFFYRKLGHEKIVNKVFFASPLVMAEQPRFNTLEERFLEVKIQRRKANRKLSRMQGFKSTACNKNDLYTSDLCYFVKSEIERLQKKVDAWDDEIIEFEALQKKK